VLLGQGGQGKVFKARSPARVEQLRRSRSTAYQRLQTLSSFNAEDPKFDELTRLLAECGNPNDDSSHLGALKLFRIPDENNERSIKALGRLESEVDALKALTALKHAAILRLRHANVTERMIVTEFHSNGTLNKHLSKYRGEALRALEAFCPLANAVAKIHECKTIHRDIKTENIFVASDGHLVLGDFGIVFFVDEQRTRLTDTYGEHVGSHYWMAPWAYMTSRMSIDEVRPSLDIFPLGKVLWSMIAGRNGFSFWEHARPENNLELLFPGKPEMRLVNRILSQCVVRDEKDCLKSAAELESLLQATIIELRRGCEKPAVGPWRCRICGIGDYVREAEDSSVTVVSQSGGNDAGRRLSTYICDHCHHAEFFCA